eukprot:358421-Chlamydomonas_euryale.AAC.9
MSSVDAIRQGAHMKAIKVMSAGMADVIYIHEWVTCVRRRRQDEPTGSAFNGARERYGHEISDARGTPRALHICQGCLLGVVAGFVW